MTENTPLDYCLQLARENAYGDYLCVLMLKPALRPRILPLVALEAELRLVAAKVSEEMLAHIRFAWWRENIEALASGRPPREHPLLAALAPVLSGQQELGKACEAMVEAVQEAWPQTPDTRPALTQACEQLLAADPKALAGWRKHQTIALKNKEKSKAMLALKLWLKSLSS